MERIIYPARTEKWGNTTVQIVDFFPFRPTFNIEPPPRLVRIERPTGEREGIETIQQQVLLPDIETFTNGVRNSIEGLKLNPKPVRRWPWSWRRSARVPSSV